MTLIVDERFRHVPALSYVRPSDGGRTCTTHITGEVGTTDANVSVVAGLPEVSSERSEVVSCCILATYVPIGHRVDLTQLADEISDSHDASSLKGIDSLRND